MGYGGRQGAPPSLFSTFLIAPVHAPRVYWDLDIQTNAVIKHRGPSEVLPPHPEVELLRSQLILKLRQHYRELCQQREGNCLLGAPLLPSTFSRSTCQPAGPREWHHGAQSVAERMCCGGDRLIGVPTPSAGIMTLGSSFNLCNSVSSSVR